MKNKRLLISFVWYCLFGKGRHMRFWQALRNWSGAEMICYNSEDDCWDTFYWEDK